MASNQTYCIPFSPRLTLRRRRRQLPTSNEAVPQQSSENDFFAKELYDLVIKRLDHGKNCFCLSSIEISHHSFLILGYDNATAVVAYMQGQRDEYQNLIKAVTSKSVKRTSRIKRQVKLSSYDTTREILIQMITAAKDISVQNTQTYITAIDEVMKNFQEHIDETYPKTIIAFRRKHIESDRLRGLFDKQHSDLSGAIENLESHKKTQRKLDEAIQKLTEDRQTLHKAEPVDQKKLEKNQNSLGRKKKKLDSSKKDVTKAENELNEAKEKYRHEFHAIYQECRGYEEEGLKAIQQVSLNFIQAIHPSNLTEQQQQDYRKLLEDIKFKHNIDEDLNSWARYHGILPSNSLENNSQSNAITTDAPRNPRTTDVAVNLADRTSSC